MTIRFVTGTPAAVRRELNVARTATVAVVKSVNPIKPIASPTRDAGPEISAPPGKFACRIVANALLTAGASVMMIAGRVISVILNLDYVFRVVRDVNQTPIVWRRRDVNQ